MGKRLPKISKAEYAQREADHDYAWLADYHHERARIYGDRSSRAMKWAIMFAVLAVIAQIVHLVLSLVH